MPSTPRAVLVMLMLGAFGAPTASAQSRTSVTGRAESASPVSDTTAVALREQPVVFHDGAISLAGLLVLPRSAGPHPAVVLVHGSGPDDGAAYAHYARAFAAAGIAALVYDKRGHGSSGGDWRRRTLDALADDALAGAAALRARPDIRATQVGLWGISQGGWVVARATARDPRIAFAVVVAGGGVSPTQQEMYHKDEIFRHLGYSPRARNAALRVWRMIFDGLVLYARGRVPIPAGVMEGELSTSRFGLDYDPVPDWRRVAERGRQPVLAVYGAEDRLTPVPETTARLRTALMAGRGRDVDVRVFPGAGHTITTRQTGLRFDWDSAFAPGYLATVTGWVRAHTGDSAETSPSGVPANYRTSPDFAAAGRYGRLPWYGRFYPQLAAFAFFAAAFAGVLLCAAVRLGRVAVRRYRRSYGLQAASTESLASRRIRRLIALLAVIDLGLLIGFVGFVRAAVYPQGMGWVESYAIPMSYRMLPVVGWISVALSLTLVIACASAWRAGALPRARIGFTGAIVAMVAFVPWLAYWRSIGPPFKSAF